MMSKKKRHDRSTKFDVDESEFASSWADKDGQEAVAAEFGIGVRTFRNWIRRKTGVDHGRKAKVFDKLHRRMGLKALPEPVDPIADMERLFELGQNLNFKFFNPLAAIEPLERIVHHHSASQVPAQTLLKHYVGILTIYRQSMYVGESQALSISRHCISRLEKLSPSDQGEPLAALVCAVAWDLTAFIVQRGYSPECLLILEEIQGLLTERHWWPHLPEGKANSMTRLLHWGHIVSTPGVSDIKSFLNHRQHPLDDIDHAKVLHRPLRFNIRLQQLVERLRFPLEEPGKQLHKAMQFFSCHFRPLFDEVGALIERGAVSTLDEMVTPSTALAAAFHASILAILAPCPEMRDIPARARQVYEWVNDTSCGSVILQEANPQTRRYVSGSGVRLRTTLPDLSFAKSVSPRAARLLLEHVRLLLARVDDCL